MSAQNVAKVVRAICGTNVALWGILGVLGGMYAMPDHATAEPETGKGAIWTADRVPVDNYAPDWQPYLRAAFDQVNAALPKSAPQFVVRNMGSKPCGKVKMQPGRIVICEQKGSGSYGTTLAKPKRGVLDVRGVKMRLVALRWDDHPANTAAHEVMHAVTWVRDCYEGHWPCVAESAVWGTLERLGAWDIALLQRMYAKRGKHHGRA